MTDEKALTVKEVKLLHRLAETGSTRVQAYRDLWPAAKNPANKSWKLWRSIREKLEIQDIYELQGLGFERLANKLNELLEANKEVIMSTSEGLDSRFVRDNTTRLGAAKLLAGLLMKREAAAPKTTKIDVRIQETRQVQVEMRFLQKDHPEEAERIREKLRREYEQQIVNVTPTEDADGTE